MAATSSPRRAGASAVGTLLYLSTGPILWALHLVIVYGAQPLICQRSASASTALTLGATVVLLGLSLAMTLLARPAARLYRAETGSPADDRFHRRVTLWLAALSSIGIAWGGAAAILIPACEQLR